MSGTVDALPPFSHHQPGQCEEQDAGGLLVVGRVGGVAHDNGEDLAHGFPQPELCQNILTRGSGRLLPVECSCGGHLSRSGWAWYGEVSWSGWAWYAEHLLGCSALKLGSRGCGQNMGVLVNSLVWPRLLRYQLHRVSWPRFLLNSGGVHDKVSRQGRLLDLISTSSQHHGCRDELFLLYRDHRVEGRDFPQEFSVSLCGSSGTMDPHHVRIVWQYFHHSACLSPFASLPGV